MPRRILSRSLEMLRTHGSKRICLHLFALVLLSLGAQGPAQGQTPPNAPAKIVRDGQALRIEYDGEVIFEGTVRWEGQAGAENQVDRKSVV